MAALKQTTISALFANIKAAAAAAAAAAAPSAAAEQPAPSPADDAPPAVSEDEDERAGPPAAKPSEAPSPPALPQPAFLPDGVSLEPLAQRTLPSFRRLITTLLPVRYPDKTYAAILANPEKTTFCRLAVYLPAAAPAAACRSDGSRGAVVGAVCARVQDAGAEGQQQRQQPGRASARGPEKELYVQMLAVLAPHRERGLASALLEQAVGEAVRAWGVRRVWAHVWEDNGDALEWYRRRGFEASDKVAGYYRRLKPDGAWVVSRDVGVLDGLGMRG